MNRHKLPLVPSILTTTVGPFPIPHWLYAQPGEQTRKDAIRVVLDIQRQAGIDLLSDGELYRFDCHLPENNGMIDFYMRQLSGIRCQVGRTDWLAFSQKAISGSPDKPAGVVLGPIEEGSLNLLAECEAAAALARGPFKFTLTSPYMLTRMLLDKYYHHFEKLTLKLATILTKQIIDLPCACVQIDEAVIPCNPHDCHLAARAINMLLDPVKVERAVHLCMGHFNGIPIPEEISSNLVEFLNALHVDDVFIELAHRPDADFEFLKKVEKHIKIGIGVIDVKTNLVETTADVARQIEVAAKKLGQDRIRWIHPDCGLALLNRSVAEQKLEVLVKGRDQYLGR